MEYGSCTAVMARIRRMINLSLARMLSMALANAPVARKSPVALSMSGMARRGSDGSCITHLARIFNLDKAKLARKRAVAVASWAWLASSDMALAIF